MLIFVITTKQLYIMAKEHKIHSLEDCRKDIMKALKYAYTIKKKRGIKKIPYDGVEITHHSILACSDNVKNGLSKDSLEYHKERGRKPIDVILTKMFQLGYQNGYLTKSESSDTFKTLYGFAVAENGRLNKENEELKKQIEELKKNNKCTH